MDLLAASGETDWMVTRIGMLVFEHLLYVRQNRRQVERLLEDRDWIQFIQPRLELFHVQVAGYDDDRDFPGEVFDHLESVAYRACSDR